MSDPESSLLHWQPVPAPAPVTLRGRTVTLEPLDAARHTADLWLALRGQDTVWTWMFDGPYASEGALRQAVEQRQAAPAAVFFALLPDASRRAEGWASLMRPDPAHGVVEVGNIVLAPSLQRTTAATEAMYLLARHVFEELGYRRYEWKCNALNLPSRRAAERAGVPVRGDLPAAHGGEGAEPGFGVVFDAGLGSGRSGNGRLRRGSRRGILMVRGDRGRGLGRVRCQLLASSF